MALQFVKVHAALEGTTAGLDEALNLPEDTRVASEPPPPPPWLPRRRKVSRPVEYDLWTMTRAGAVATCRLRPCAAGWEARLDVGRSMVWCHEFATAVEAGAMSDRHRARLVAEGWVLVG